MCFFWQEIQGVVNVTLCLFWEQVTFFYADDLIAGLDRWNWTEQNKNDKILLRQDKGSPEGRSLGFLAKKNGPIKWYIDTSK